MTIIELLNEMRGHGGPAKTKGLQDGVIEAFARRDPQLSEAVETAHRIFRRLQADEAELLAMDEDSQIRVIQSGYVNFYAGDAINPYVALTGKGPWVITLKGAVQHDSGGYGMLMGPFASTRERREYARQMRANPSNYIGQPLVEISSHATYLERSFRPRRTVV